MAKTYVKGSAKLRQTNYGPILKVSLKADDLIAFAKQHANQRGYLNLDIVERKEVGQYGDTHSIVLDDFVPQTGAGARQDDIRRNGPARPQAQSQPDGYEPSPFDTDPF